MAAPKPLGHIPKVSSPVVQQVSEGDVAQSVEDWAEEQRGLGSRLNAGKHGRCAGSRGRCQKVQYPGTSEQSTKPTIAQMCLDPTEAQLQQTSSTGV